MAKKPYVKASKTVAKRNKRPPIGEPIIINSDSLSFANEQETLAQVVQIANRSLSRTITDPAECISGGCPPIYIPVILQFYNTSLESSNSTQADITPTGGAYATHVSLAEKYNDITTSFASVNKALAGEALETSIMDSMLKMDVAHSTPGSVHSTVISLGEKKHISRINPKDFKYPTGSQIYDDNVYLSDGITDNPTYGDLIDEYASYIEQGDQLPNVRFFFPKRLRAEYFLDQPLFPADTGCGVSISEVLEYMGESPAGTVGQWMAGEFIYFDENYPGVVTWEEDETNEEFFTKLNQIQKVIKGNDFPMDVVQKIIGNTYHAWNPDMLGVTYKYFYNHQKPTVFNNLSYSYHASIFGVTNKWNSILDLYSNKKTSGDVYIFPSTILHEWGHAHGLEHPWSSPVLGGEGAAITVVNSSSGFNTSNTLGLKSTKVTETESSIGNVFNYPLKPPFIYEEYNYKYPLRQRDSNKADVDYDYWVEHQSNNRSIDLNDVVESYFERKNYLNQKLAETDESITHDFFNISAEEKGYIEFIFNRAIPEYTDGFTMKYTFTSALENSEGRASISLNKIPSKTNDDGTTSDVSSLFRSLVHSAYTGIQSFWGGSIVFNDPALMPSVETVVVPEEAPIIQIGEVYRGGYIFQINEDGTGLVAAMDELDQSYWGCGGTELSGAEGQAIGTGYQNTLDIVAGCSEPNTAAGTTLAYESGGYSDWYLPSLNELSEMYNTIGNGGPQGNTGDFIATRYWSSSEYNSSLAWTVNFNTGGSSLFDKYGTTKVRAIRSVTFGDVEPTPVGPSPYEAAFLDAILANPDAPTSLVVNPEDYSGNRRGPNVTTHIPFCTQANGIPSTTDLSLNTKFDVHWAHNFNAYNSAYPEYPANTKVEDLLNADYCPCLRTLQTYYSEGEAYEYTIISPESNAWALHRLYETHVSNEPQENDSNLSASQNIALSRLFKTRTKGWNNLFSKGGVYRDSTSFAWSDRADIYSIQWLIHTTTNLNTSQTNSELHLHEYPNGEKLSLPTFSGYCGAGGYSTVVPNVLKVDAKAAYESVSDDPSELKKAEYLSKQIDVPNEYFLGYGFSAHNTNLRIKSELPTQNLGVLNPQTGAELGNYVVAYTQNAEHRYAVGEEDPAHALYNPLRKYDTQTKDYMHSSISEGTVITTLPNALAEQTGNFPTYSITGEFSNTFDFYTDLYGEYNPLYMNDIMSYEGTGLNRKQLLFPINTVRGINWYYNDSNNNIPAIYKSVYEDDLEADSAGKANQFEALISYFTNKVKQYYVGDLIGGCMDSAEGHNYNSLATYDNGSCIDKIYGCTQEWADNYDELANTEDGSCQVELCIDSSAAAGYDSSLVSSVQSYGVTYNTTAYTEAAEEIVDSLTESNTALCQFLIDPRPAIIRMVCGDEAVSGNPSIQSCNYNPLIKYIRDADDFNITAYTSNPEVVEENYEDFRVSNSVGYIAVRSLYPLPLESGQTFPSTLTTYDPITGGNSTSQSLVVNDVLDNSAAMENGYGLNYRYIYKYNCVENPILPDGSGGCYLYEHPFSNCIFTEVSSQTYNDCGNVVLFGGGVLVDVSFFADYDLIAQTSECPADITQYVIGGEWALQYGEAAVANGIKIPFTSLPVYSEYQIHEETGYPIEMLNAAQIPQESRNRITKREDPVVPEIVTSNAFTVLTSILLFTGDGRPYTGKFKFTLNVETDVKVYYSYNSETGELTDILYFRTELLRLPNVLLTPQEEYVKKMHKVINKIINLTTFTTN